MSTSAKTISKTGSEAHLATSFIDSCWAPAAQRASCIMPVLHELRKCELYEMRVLHLTPEYKAKKWWNKPTQERVYHDKVCFDLPFWLSPEWMMTHFLILCWREGWWLVFLSCGLGDRVLPSLVIVASSAVRACARVRACVRACVCVWEIEIYVRKMISQIIIWISTYFNFHITGVYWVIVQQKIQLQTIGNMFRK